MMAQRERFLHTFRFEIVDHVPDVEFGAWDETFRRWHREGLPFQVNSNDKMDIYFGFEYRAGVPINLGLIPAFESKVLEEDEHTWVLQDGAGVISRQMKGASSIPQYIKFPVETREDFERIKERYNPDDPGRYPKDWEELKKEWEIRDYPLGIGVGGYYGWARGLMGMENLACAFALQPDLIHEMFDFITDFVLKVIDRALNEVELDYASWWEDMCFNKGPLISPQMFKEFMVPQYSRVTKVLREHGIEINIVDCDGNINKLVPLWLEAGVNCMFPLEIRAHSDPVALRKKYGRQVLLMGGVDKFALIQGKEAIDRELERKAPLIEEGGYIPHVDHRVPPDVSFDNYLYYLEQKRKLIGVS